MSRKSRKKKKKEKSLSRRSFLKSGVAAGAGVAVAAGAGAVLAKGPPGNRPRPSSVNSIHGDIQRELNEFTDRFRGHYRENTLRLTDEAKSVPFSGGSGILDNIRDTILRQGAWQDVPIIPKEIFLMTPSPEVVVPGIEFDIRTVGWGKFSGNIALGLVCMENDCGKQSLTGTGDDADWCHVNTCTDQRCEDFDCGTNDCPGNTKCGTNPCDTQSGILEIVNAFKIDFRHPFVYEFMDYLGSSDIFELANDVISFEVCGAVDTSLLPEMPYGPPRGQVPLVKLDR